MMNRDAYLNIRTLYHFGILLLVLYAIPVTRNFMSPVLDGELLQMPIISIIGVAVGVGAYFAYFTRRLG